jgi:hypothetical protein
MDEDGMAELGTLLRDETSGLPIVLEVKDLILAGQETVDSLGRCKAAGVRLVHRPPYARECITREKNGG